MKSFLYKLYDKDLNIKQTINPNIIMNDVGFSEQINGGQGSINIQLAVGIDNTDYSIGDFVKIFVYDEINTAGSVLYFGIIDDIVQNADSYEYLTLQVNGIGSLLSRILYFNSSYVVNITNQDPAEIITAIFNYLNTIYNNIFDTSGITNFGTNINYNFDYTYCNEAINDIVKQCANYYRRVDSDGLVVFAEKNTTNQKILNYDREMFSFENEKTGIEIVNRLILKYNATDTKVYNDSTSQGLYGLRESYEEKEELQNETQADLYAAAFFESNANPVNQIKALINDTYYYGQAWIWDDMVLTWDEYDLSFDELIFLQNIENLKCGDVCKIRNLSNNYENLIIAKKKYTPNKINIDFEKYDSFIKLIKQ